jgi:2-polyprenyl-6-methoxyphenol hydroxylase-like FAD-dependent oxidoreductase
VPERLRFAISPVQPSADAQPTTETNGAKKTARASKLERTLTRLELKKVGLERMQAIQHGVRSAVVLGGGPGGLMAAINLIKHGASVTVVELREGRYSRPIHFNIRQNMLDELAALDPELVKLVMERAGVIEQAEFIDATIGKRLENPPRSFRAPDAARAAPAPRQMLESSSVVQLKVSDLEEILSGYLSAIERRDRENGRDPPRVKLMFDHDAELEDPGDGHYRVTVHALETHVDEQGRSERVRGESLSIGAPDLVVVAEGANSATRRALHIKQNPTSPETRFVAGYLDTPSGGLLRRRYDEIADPATGEVSGVRQIQIGHSKKGKTWLLAEVPKHVQFESPADVERFYREQAALIMDRPREEVDRVEIEWGPNPFRLQQWISDRQTAGDNVILLGDAVGNAHFLTSGGVMTASVPHQIALSRLLDDIATGKRRDQALAFYGSFVRNATLEWARLGIREFGRQVGAGNFGKIFSQLLSDLRAAEGKGPAPAEDLRARSLSITDRERALEISPQAT